MPLTIRTEDEVYLDLVRDIAANSAGKISDANIGAVLRTVLREGLSPEFASGYHSLVEVLESALIDKAQGSDLDLRIGDWKFADAEDVIERLGAVAASGWATFFGAKADSGVATAAGSSTTLTDASKAWTTNAWAGKMLRIVGGVGVGQERKILSNTATVLTLDTTAGWTAFATNPAVGTKYEIISVVSGDKDVPLGTTVYAQGPTLDDRLRFKSTVTARQVSAAPATGGTSGAAPTLIDANQAWTINEHVGRAVIIRSGTGSGQVGVVKSNTSSVLTITPIFPYAQWATAPTAASNYEILEGRVPSGAGKAPVPVRAVATGVANNIALYSLTNFENQPSGLGAVWNTNSETTPAAFSTGRDVELDPDFRQRFRRKLQKLTRGTKLAIIQGIKDYAQSDGTHPVKSVGINATVYPAKIYIEEGGGTAAAGLVTTIQELVNGTGAFASKHPLQSDGYPHDVVSGTATTVNVVVAIGQLRDGFTFSAVKDDITTRIKAHFDSANLGLGDDVSYDRFLVAAVATGVLDLTTATINGGTADIAVAVTHKAVLGTLTIS